MCAGVGLCNFGCGVDLKGNMNNSFLPLALATGNLTVLTDCEVKSVVGEEANGSWTASVAVSPRTAVSRSATKITAIKARRKVIVAAGAFFSSSILLRSSGFPNRHSIGQKIYLNPTRKCLLCSMSYDDSRHSRKRPICSA